MYHVNFINDRQFLKFLAVPTLLRLQFDYLICCLLNLMVSLDLKLLVV